MQPSVSNTGAKVRDFHPTLEEQGLFFNEADAALAAQFAPYEHGLVTSRPSFGAAGGPHVLELTNKGWEHAYCVASSGRFPLSTDHIHALRTIAGFGADGVGFDQLPAKEYSYAKALEFQIFGTKTQASLAAALRGDEEAYKQIRDRNQLIWVDIAAWPPRMKITSLGQDFIASANHVAAAMRRAYPGNEQAVAACSPDEHGNGPASNAKH